LNPFALSSSLTQFWLDSSVLALRSAAEFWNGILSTDARIGQIVTRTSTAAPWWKAAEPSQTPLNGFAWASMWTPAAAPRNVTPDPMQFWAAAWAPWLPRSTPAAPSTLNAMEFWQQPWLQNMPQLAALAASFARPSAFGSAWPATWPSMAPAAVTAPVPAAWEPIMAAYRTANGHAMAAVLRTFADVVEPKPRQPNFADFWVNPLATRH
jgi:hypothetical protein